MQNVIVQQTSLYKHLVEWIPTSITCFASLAELGHLVEKGTPAPFSSSPSKKRQNLKALWKFFGKKSRPPILLRFCLRILEGSSYIPEHKALFLGGRNSLRFSPCIWKSSSMTPALTGRTFQLPTSSPWVLPDTSCKSFKPLAHWAPLSHAFTALAKVTAFLVVEQHGVSPRVKWFNIPIASMYGIFTYIYHKNQPNVGKYTIHGLFGI